jgi:hypothetical protein
MDVSWQDGSRTRFSPIAFLKRNSKLYLWLKNTVSDLSRVWFMRALKKFDPSAEEFHQTRTIIKRIQDKVLRKNKQFIIVILPFEYQLRTANEKYLHPQHLINRICTDFQIPCLDPLEFMRSSDSNSKSFFLYGDAMHLSPKGHKAVFTYLINQNWFVAKGGSQFSTEIPYSQ